MNRLLRRAIKRLEREFPGMGVALFVFPFGEYGNIGWISNANREDMIKVLRDHADHLEHGVASPIGES